MTSSSTKGIVVIGSVNMDLMLHCPHLPSPGETVLGHTFTQAPGGKGANQAIAAAKLGAKVSFIGCLGDDSYGQASRASFEALNVNIQHLHASKGESTGIAMITTDDKGENCIALAPGANLSLSCSHLDQAETLIAEAGMVVCQLESPLATALHAMKLAQRHNVPFLLNPSPAQKLPAKSLAGLSVLVLNEVEAAMLSDSKVETMQQACQAAEFFRSTGIEFVVITLGKNGAVVADDDGTHHFAAPKIKAFDTTGAGDTLVGALAAALMSGSRMVRAIEFAQRAAAFSVTRRGAQASMPDLNDLREFTTPLMLAECVAL
jgi:ribokinase